VTGALLGAGVSGAVAVTALALIVPLVDMVAGIGVLVGAALGGWFAPKAATTDEPFQLAFRISVLAMPMGGAVFGLVTVGTTAPVLALITTALAPVLYPVLGPVVLPITLVAIAAGRRLIELPTRSAGLVLGVLLAADVAGLAVSPAIADLLSPTMVSPSGELLRTGPHWFMRLTAAERVEVSVINRSDDPVFLGLRWPIGGGFEGETGQSVPGCFAMATTMLAERDWKLHVNAGPWGDAADPGMLIADAGDFDGDAALVLEVDDDNHVSSRPGGLPDSELGQIPGCEPTG
jgi:hypothetical protein